MRFERERERDLSVSPCIASFFSVGMEFKIKPYRSDMKMASLRDAMSF